MKKKVLEKALEDLAEVLGGDEAFESDCVYLDKKAKPREIILASVISKCHRIVHPLTSKCCAKENEYEKEN